MDGFNAQVQAKEMVLEAVVTRADGTIENLGAIAYWNKNPLKRLLHRLLHKSGTITRQEN